LVENLSVPFDRRVWLEATTLRDAGYSVSVICPKGRKGDTESFVVIDSIAIYRYQLPPTATATASYIREYAVAMLQTLRLSLKVYRQRGFQVIHGCCPPDLFFAIALLYRPFGVRYIFDHHDLSPEIFLANFGSAHPLTRRLLVFLEQLTFRTAHTVITTNESLRGIALRRGGVEPNRIFVVRTGPDFARLHQVPKEDQPQLGYNHMVAYLGVMDAHDGVDYVLRAANLVVHHHGRTDIGFVLIGSGDQAGNLKAMTDKFGLRSNVTFTGRVSDTELVAYLSASDVCLSPDPMNGFNELHTMNKTMEYMAMGKPVVAFDLLETRRSAADAGVYARPNDLADFAAKIIELVDDPVRCKAMGEYGIRRVQDELSWDHSRARLLEAYVHAFAGIRRGR
jgi:glycosyltransferase involved in cell wall biosynthesis